MKLETYRVKRIVQRVELFRVKAKDAQHAESRALRGVGKRIAVAETCRSARYVGAGL